MDEYRKGIKPFDGVMAAIQFDKLNFIYKPEHIINLEESFYSVSFRIVVIS